MVMKWKYYAEIKKKRNTCSSNFEFQQKYIAHQTAICFNPRTRNFTGQKKKTGLTFTTPTSKHVSLQHFNPYRTNVENRVSS